MQSGEAGEAVPYEAILERKKCKIKKKMVTFSSFFAL